MVTDERPFTTRESFRADLRAELDDRFTAVTQEVDDTDVAWHHVPVVTRKDLGDVLADIFGRKLPPPADHKGEVTTPAEVFVSIVCPKCDMPGLVKLALTGQLIVDDDGSKLKLKAKASQKIHVCGQLELPDQVEGQSSFELEDIIGTGTEMTGMEVPADGTEATIVADDESTAGERLEGCPFPGCTREADHRGTHKLQVPFTAAAEDDDLLPS